MEIYHDMPNAGEKRLLTLAMENRTPIYGSLELTPLCNMNCDMCYVRLSPGELAAKGRLRSTEEWLALAGEMVESGVLYLQLTGGEPLLYPGFRELFAGLQEMGMILTVNTNGTLMDEKWAAFFAEHRPRRVNISLYGINDRAYRGLCRYPGGYAAAIEGIRCLREKNIDVKLNVPFNNMNKEDMERYNAVCEELGTAINQDTYLFPAVRERTRAFRLDARPSPEECAAARFWKIKKDMGEGFREHVLWELSCIDSLPDKPFFSRKMECLAAGASFVVNWQGMLRPCIMLSSPEVPVFDVGFGKAWEILCTAADGMLLPEPCGCCRLRTICDVCAASGVLEEKDEQGRPVYICRTAEELERLMREETAHG